MVRQIVLWLLGWIARGLDPELDARVNALNEKVKTAEAEREKLLARIEAGKQKNISLLLELAENNRKRIELENAILHAKESAAAKKAELDSLSPSDAVRVDL